MAAEYLGSFFDIHCGGEDHISVHHTNEIAQTEACHGTHLANFWMHGYFLQLNEAKMAKSAGDFLRLQTLIDMGYDPMAYRFFSLSASYRTKLNFNWESLAGASSALNRLRTAVYDWGEPGTLDEDYMDRFADHINDDLNMPRALALTWELVKSDLPASTKKATILEFDRVLGLRLAEWEPPKEEEIPAEILELAEKRQLARTEKRWTDADALRDEITAAGYMIEDTAEGPRISKQ
jgi:cysteinyl-tRNA synthetase